MRRWARWLPVSRSSQLIMLILLVLACQQLATLTWRLLPAPAAKSAPLNLPVARGPAPAPLDPGPLLALTLFGKAENAAAVLPPPRPTDGNAPRTKLNLTLTGVLASTVPSRSIAIILSAGDESTYGPGETIHGTRAKLRAVQPDRVIIDNQGQDETLMLDGETYKAAPAGAAPPGPPPANGPDLHALRDDLVKDPGKLLDYVNSSPVRNGDKLSGYRVNPGKDPGFFSRLGLQANDLAVAINGYDLRDTGQAMQIMNQLPNMTEMTLTLERNGQQQDVYINLAQ